MTLKKSNRHMASSIKNYNSNLKVMKEKLNTVDNEYMYQDVEQELESLLIQLDSLKKKVIEVVVDFDGFDCGIDEMPLLEYIECKKLLLLTLNRVRLIECLIRENIIDVLERFDNCSDLEDKLNDSLESDYQDEWDGLIRHINNNVDGASANYDELNSTIVTISKDNGKIKLL